MKKLFEKLFKFNREEKKQTPANEARRVLESKVEQGTSRAVKEYGEVFRKLAEYDRS
ncbi:MAG: hypothetical protein V1656_01910 [Candidatus Jorgensenbacteria bacterium]